MQSSSSFPPWIGEKQLLVQGCLSPWMIYRREDVDCSCITCFYLGSIRWTHAASSGLRPLSCFKLCFHISKALLAVETGIIDVLHIFPQAPDDYNPVLMIQNVYLTLCTYTWAQIGCSVLLLRQSEISRSAWWSTHPLRTLFPILSKWETTSSSVRRPCLTVICCVCLQYSVIYGIPALITESCASWLTLVCCHYTQNGRICSIALRAKALTNFGSAAENRRYCGSSTCARWK